MLVWLGLSESSSCLGFATTRCRRSSFRRCRFVHCVVLVANHLSTCWNGVPPLKFYRILYSTNKRCRCLWQMYKYRLYERHFAFCLFFHVCIIATSTTINSPLPFHGKRRRSPAAFLFGKPPICNASPTALRSARSPDVQLSDCDPAFVGRRKRTMKESHFCLGGINHHDILVHKKPT